MKIRLTSPAIGPEGNFPAGAVLDAPGNISMALARGLVAGGYAVDLSPAEPAYQTADVAAPETAAIRARRGRR